MDTKNDGLRNGNDPFSISEVNDMDPQDKDWIQSFLDISSRLYLAKTYEDVGKSIVEVLHSFKSGVIHGIKLAIYDSSEDKYTIVYQTEGVNKEIFKIAGFPSGVPVPLSEVKYYSKIVIEQQETLIIQDNHSEYSLSISPVQKEIPGHSMIFIPLIYDNSFLGLLSFARSPKNSMTPTLVNFLESITKNAAMLISKMMNEKKRQIIEKRVLENQMLYKSLMEVSPNEIMLMDANNIISSCNQQAARLYGYDNPEQMIGLNILELISSEERFDFKKKLMDYSKENKITFNSIKLLKKDGTPMLVEMNLKPIFDSTGKFKALISVTSPVREL